MRTRRIRVLVSNRERQEQLRAAYDARTFIYCPELRENKESALNEEALVVALDYERGATMLRATLEFFVTGGE